MMSSGLDHRGADLWNMLKHASGIRCRNFAFATGLPHLHGDEGHLLGQVDTGAFENRRR